MMHERVQKDVDCALYKQEKEAACDAAVVAQAEATELKKKLEKRSDNTLLLEYEVGANIRLDALHTFNHLVRCQQRCKNFS